MTEDRSQLSHRCPIHEDVGFIPIIGPHPSEHKFGIIGLSCPFICEEVLKDWEKKVQEDPWLKYSEPICDYSKIYFIHTIEIEDGMI